MDSLVSAGMEAFPELFGSLGFPTSMDKLERMTPFELAVSVFNRWCTEKELVDELTERAKSALSQSMIDFSRFCVQAMLYWFNVSIDPKYRALFVSAD